MAREKTIQNSFALQGRGLQTGNPVEITFSPQGAGEGITLVRGDLQGSPAVSLAGMAALAGDRASKISITQGQYIETVEHILAALWGAGVDNVRVELSSSEPPALDGSAKDFLAKLQEVGTTDQPREKDLIVVGEPIWCEEGESFLGIFPSDHFKISYILDYPIPSIGRQSFSHVITEELFASDIASARTFCMRREAEALLAMGYGKGADLSNTLVMDETGPINNTLRFPDEHVRHKVLDLIGDLYILGKSIRGRIIAVRSGHKLNLELVSKIREISCRPLSI